MNDDWCTVLSQDVSTSGEINEIYLSRAQVGYIAMIEEGQ